MEVGDPPHGKKCLTEKGRQQLIKNGKKLAQETWSNPFKKQYAIQRMKEETHKKRMLLSKEELKPTIRGKVHFYDSEDGRRQYRKNINKDIIKAYNEALEYTINRIQNYCNSRNASYLLVPSEQQISELFLKTLPEMVVLI